MTEARGPAAGYAHARMAARDHGDGVPPAAGNRWASRFAPGLAERIAGVGGRLPVARLLRAAQSAGLRLATASIALVFGIAGARLLGADVFGAYVSLFAVAGLLTVATSAGLPTLLSREIASARGNGDGGALRPLAQGLVVVNALLCIATAAALLLGHGDGALILLYCVVGNAAAVLGAVFVGRERVLLAGWIGNVVRPVVALAALVVIAGFAPPRESVPLAAQIAGALAAALLLLLWRGRPPLRVGMIMNGAWWSAHHRALLRAGALLAGTQVLINLTTQVDIVILTVLSTPQDVAHYYAAARAALVVGFFASASGMLAEPTLARLYAASDRAGLEAITESTAWIGLSMTILAALGALFLAPFYLGLHGPGFEAAFPSFCVFVTGMVVASAFGPAQPLLRATRCEGALLRHTATALAVNAVLTAALVPVLGILGAAIGSAVQFAVYGALMAHGVRQRRGLHSPVTPAVRLRRTQPGKGSSARPVTDRPA